MVQNGNKFMDDNSQDRRKNDALFIDRIEKIHDKFDNFQKLLTGHMKEEEEMIREINRRIDDFFYDIDPKRHVKHHTFVQELKDSDEDISKIKREQISKWVDRIVFVVVTFICASVYFNVKYELGVPNHQLPRLEQNNGYTKTP